MSTGRLSAQLNELRVQRLTSEARARAMWQDVVMQSVADRHLLPLHVQEQALATSLDRARERIDAALRKLDN